MLSIRNLHIRSREKKLVRGISFDIGRGEILALVGESGSGKSLTCLSVLSLLSEGLVAEGSIQYHHPDGSSEEILPMNTAMRKRFALRKIAYIFQEPLTALNPVQTCGKQLSENIRLSGIRGRAAIRAKAGSLLLGVGLQDSEKVMKAYPFQLSGGQRQRVMIAMAMAGDPELIIADEPTTALDVLLQEEILSLLRKICMEQHRSMLLVSHDLDAVRRFSDRIAVMYRGEIIESAAAEELIENPAHPYTKALLACRPGPHNKGLYLRTLADMENAAPERSFSVTLPSEEVLTEIRNLGKVYRSGGKSFKALQDVCFQIRTGSSTGLIGESGSGKSTVSRLLVQLEQADEGSIVYDFKNGKPLTSNVQMIFQDPFAALNPALTVESMLNEVLALHGGGTDGRDEASALLYKVGLTEADLKKYPVQFSGGQRQRLCIARALAARPRLLICDESTSALDLSVQAQILNLLKELQISEQLSILMITHSMAVAAWFCDELIVLKDGRIVESGPAATLISNPSRPYTKALLTHL